MLGFYNYTVILTYFGMLASLTGIVYAIDGNSSAALACLMVSGVCDMFDGKVASTKIRTEKEKRFGVQIDSLSDLICFGVLPALLVYKVSEGNIAGFYISGIYLLCALIRLAYFNVDEEERQTQTDAAREEYHGLPVTTAALLLPALFCLCHFLRLPLAKLAPALLFIMGVAFLTPFRLKKPKLAGKVSMLLCGSAEIFVLLMAGGDI